MESQFRESTLLTRKVNFAWGEVDEAQNRRRYVMGKAVSRGQALQVVGRLGTQVNWDELDGDLLQRDIIDLSPEEFGKRFTAFLKNGGRFIFGDPKSIPTKPFDPASFLGKNWTTWKGPVNGDGLSGEEDVDPRGLALTEIEISKLIFKTNLKKSESSIRGEEKLRRQKEMSVIRHRGNAFLGLWEDYQANKENSVLEYLYRTQKITFLDFMGQILRFPDGVRIVLFLYRVGGEWGWNYYWLDDDWDASNPSACSQV